ncbi:MAG: hypothetical protein WBD05_02610 [Phycisphaerae bacterium]
MDIAKAIEEAIEHGGAPPPNESNTCEWVILPVLYAIGYGKREVVSRDADSAGKFPDYTLLPGAPEHTFYLEAKAWKADLEGSHARQALNYANQNGKRWVVLTNGRQWHLYDNSVCGLPADKMVAEMSLDNRDQAVRFLQAISKASVSSNGLARFATEEAERRKQAMEAERRRQIQAERQSRLSSVLQAELTNESSPLVAAMLAHLRRREGLTEIGAEDLITHFTGATAEPRKEEIAPSRPDVSASEKVLVIPARDAWQDYLNFSAYMCQPRRKFRATSHIAFYRRKVIEPSVPRILQVVEEIEMSERGVSASPGLDEATRNRLLAIVHELRESGERRHLDEKRKVLLLSTPQSAETITLPHRIVHERPTAFTQGQRYVSLSKIRAGPKTTAELTQH